MNILIISGHPDKESYNNALAKAYYEGAKESIKKVDLIHVRELNFDPNLEYGYRKRTDLEPDLELSIEKIKKADHIVWVLPLWWGGMPAILKGFIDRTLLPGVAFEIEEGKVFQKKLLKNKSGRIIITGDTPKWYLKLHLKNPLINQLKKGVLEFCGIKPVKTTYIAPIRNSTEEFRKKWLSKIYLLGKQLK